MRMYDLIMKKRNGGALSAEEMKSMIGQYIDGTIPEYQMAAFLMAVYFRGMTPQETLAMTDAVAHSGDLVDLSGIPGIKVDKHSTGGVGDKTSLIAGPMAAACGVKIAKMSGRGLGHTGGTIDKLESIPGFRTALSQEEFFSVVNQTGISIVGQTGNLAPADKKLYALRDVTATVDSIPLIAVSIMGKKLAAGSDRIVLDVKTGSGAFMKNLDDSIALAAEMVSIGENAGKQTVALITDMDRPLGTHIGNSLEIEEAVETLRGHGPEELTRLCVLLAANMVSLAEQSPLSDCIKKVEASLADGSALQKLIDMTEAQGGDSAVLRDPGKLAQAAFSQEVKAVRSGYIARMDTEKCGIASVMLGAGRETKDSVIDPSAGIILQATTGDYVTQGQTLAVLYASQESLFAQAAAEFQSSVVYMEEKPLQRPLLLARVTKDGVERFA
ncbi:MAG: thymidine phosphorylase [Lachnospiraceae bacterium]